METDDDGNCYLPQRLLDEIDDDDDFDEQKSHESEEMTNYEQVNDNENDPHLDKKKSSDSEETINQEGANDNDSFPDLNELAKILTNCGPEAKQSMSKIWPSRCDGPQM